MGKTEPGPLKGKVALVTGASRGIGKGIATELATAGALVYITARSIDQRHESGQGYGAHPGGTARQVVEEIEALGGRAVAIGCDHADDEQAGNVVRVIEAEEGRLDVLVNNAMATEAAGAGRGPESGGTPFWRAPLEFWDRVTDVGLRSHFVMTVTAMPLLMQSKGLVVNVSSAGAETYYLSVAYGVQKSGTDRMIRDMAHETGPGSVTFLSLWPGFVRTERTSQAREQLLMGYRGVRELVARRSGEPVEEVSADSVQIESQRFAGMAVTALASDPDVNRLSGRIVSTAGVAAHYGYTDIDGTIPDGFSFLKAGVWHALCDPPAAERLDRR